MRFFSVNTANKIIVLFIKYKKSLIQKYILIKVLCLYKQMSFLIAKYYHICSYKITYFGTFFSFPYMCHKDFFEVSYADMFQYKNLIFK